MMGGISHGLNERGSIVTGGLLNPTHGIGVFVRVLTSFLVSSTVEDRLAIRGTLDRFLVSSTLLDRFRW